MLRLLPIFAYVVGALYAGAEPRRIVSTTPSITEILFAVGAGERVVGVTNYCHFPAAGQIARREPIDHAERERQSG